MRTLIIALLGWILVVGCEQKEPSSSTANASSQAEPAGPGVAGRTPEAVREVVAAYKTAILNERGEAAAECVDAESIGWYTESRRLALHGSREELQKLGLMNRLQALLVRHRVPRGQLEQMDGKALFVHAVDEGWVGKNSVTNLEVGDVTINEDFASAEIVQQGKPTKSYFQFIWEGGSWRLKLLPLLKAAEPAMKAHARRSGMGEDEFLVEMVESISGSTVDESIWGAGKAPG